MNDSQRIAKFLSAAGVAARRKAEEAILQGRVSVNGTVLSTPAFLVNPKTDTVLFDGKKVHPPSPSSKICILLNKPSGYTCTMGDKHAPHTIYELLPPKYRSLRYAGRLDRDTEGLLLLTNDGELIQMLTHPSCGISKIYLACCQGNCTEQIRKKLLEGVHDDGDFLKPQAVSILSANRHESILKITLLEGRKREIRRLCGAVDLPVWRLARIQQGPVTIGTLPQGQWRALTREECKALRDAGARKPRP